MSTITFATRKVGKSRKLRNNNPKNNPGPRWKGVKGIVCIILVCGLSFFVYFNQNFGFIFAEKMVE
jgi:hypothetical protein